MGRKRQTRKRTDRVQSKTSLNSGNISSDSDSETSLISHKESQTVCGQKTSAYADRNAPTQATVSTSFGSHGLSDQTAHADGAESASYDRSELTQEHFHSEKIRHTQHDHGQYHISKPSDSYDTDQAAPTLPVDTGRGRLMSPVNLNHAPTNNARPDTSLLHVGGSGENSDTDQTIHSTGASLLGRGSLMIRESQRGEDSAHAQAENGLQSALELGANSDVDQSAHCVADSNRGYSGPPRVTHSDAVLQNTQACKGLRSSGLILQNSQTGNSSVGSGEDASLQTSGDSITSVIQNFCYFISKQNETQNTRISQQTEALNAQISQQNEIQNNMLRECLTGITNVVRENNASVSQCMNGITGQLSNLTGLIRSSREQTSCAREVTQTTESNSLCDTVTSLGSCQYQNTVASNDLHQTAISRSNQPSHSAHNTQTAPSYSYVHRPDSSPTVHASEPQTAPAQTLVQNNCSRPRPSEANKQDSSPTFATLGTHPTASDPSQLNIQNTNNAASTSRPHGTSELHSRNRNVKLPAFTGNCNDSWKVWYSRFKTVANLNNWDEPTRLSELVQRLQGTAADFVFDEIPQGIISNFPSLVHELGLRFQTVETNKTFRVQFGKRTQRIGESVEDYSAELKRIYDKAYPGRNPEMRRQLLLQQFLNGLRDKQAKFAVEYFKEPCTIEEAVHNLVTYTEAQQGHNFDTSRPSDHTKSVRFLSGVSVDGEEADDDSRDDERFGNTANISRPLSSFSGQKEKQTVRKVQTTPSNSDSNATDLLSQILHCMTELAERKLDESGPNKTQVTPRTQDQLHRHGQSRLQNTNQGQIPRQGQMRPQPQGQGQPVSQNRLANVQCFHCSNFGHFKRECPILQAAEQNLNGTGESKRRVPQQMQWVPRATQGPVRQQNIALN